ncbi:MAG: nucleoside hydrolase [Actinomycetaceae bacterium]|nr:nucleoside hydrolase [Actinomycetaceae bacterium]
MTRLPQPNIDHGIPADRRWHYGQTPWREIPPCPPCARVIVDNDFAGDPDDLYQLVHHLLSPSVEIVGIVASHLRANDPSTRSLHTATDAELIVRDLFARMGCESTELIWRGAEHGLPDISTPVDSPAVQGIIAEALKEDDRPLYYAAGGGLTDLASAILLEPEVARRLTLVWVGGPEWVGLADPPVGHMPIEYNLMIDVNSGRVCFDTEDLIIWQVPRSTYRQCIIAESELRIRIGGTGPLGKYMFSEIQHMLESCSRDGNHPITGGYDIGDNALILITALQTVFEADTSSSKWLLRPTPRIMESGDYRPMAATRQMRVYTDLDMRLIVEDMCLKIQEFAHWQATGQAS